MSEPIGIRFTDVDDTAIDAAGMWKAFWQHEACGEVGYILTDADDFDEAAELLRLGCDQLTATHVCR